MEPFEFECPCCKALYEIDPEQGEYEQILSSDLDETDAFDEIEEEQHYESEDSLPQKAPEFSTVDGPVVTQPTSHYKSGIKTTTHYGPNPEVRKKKEPVEMQGMGQLKNVVRPPKRKKGQHTDADHAREGFESYGSNASEDFVGMTGRDGHFENLLQGQFESDPWGFSNSPNH